VKPALVVGAYGTFGTQVSAELSRRGVPLTVAGRDGSRAEAWARTLGGGCQARAVDVRQPASCRAALRGHAVVANCAGPFHDLDSTLLEACLDAGCHYTDIADDRAYTARVRGHDAAFRRLNLAAVYGCSSLPGLSGALALRLRERNQTGVSRARVTLFIGNRNPKGQAAVASLVTGLGRPIVTAGRTLRAFRDREVVPLPAPFGRRAVYNFESPDYDLFPSLLDSAAVVVKVGFELRLATFLFALLARFGPGYGPGTTRLLASPGQLFGRLGCSGGAVMMEFFLANGQILRAALVARTEGQRMAALPCALAAEALATDRLPARGALTAYDFLGSAGLLDAVVAAGFELHGTAEGEVRTWAAV
jgi:hypothetical protein